MATCGCCVLDDADWTRIWCKVKVGSRLCLQGCLVGYLSTNLASYLNHLKQHKGQLQCHGNEGLNVEISCYTKPIYDFSRYHWFCSNLIRNWHVDAVLSWRNACKYSLKLGSTNVQYGTGLLLTVLYKSSPCQVRGRLMQELPHWSPGCPVTGHPVATVLYSSTGLQESCSSQKILL